MNIRTKGALYTLLAFGAFLAYCAGWDEGLCVLTLFLLLLVTIVDLDSDATYWRGRSKAFYERQQHLIDTGVIEWDTLEPKDGPKK